MNLVTQGFLIQFDAPLHIWIGAQGDDTGSCAGVPCYVWVKTGRQAPAEAAENVLMFREESMGTQKGPTRAKSRDPREVESED